MKQLLTTFADGDVEVKLYYTGKGSYTVEYGAHIVNCAYWQHAAEEFGYCMMHSLECAGKIIRP